MTAAEHSGVTDGVERPSQVTVCDAAGTAH